MFGEVDWGKVFLPGVPLPELFVRGTVMDLIIFTLLRAGQQRQSSSLSVTDVLVAAVPALGGEEASSIIDGAMLVATIMFWSFALNWLAYKFPIVDRFVQPPPLPLVQDVHRMRRNLRRELVTEEELRTQLRQQGVEDFSEVKGAYLEGDGNISIITRETQGRTHAGS